jgi:hypothetical protein
MPDAKEYSGITANRLQALRNELQSMGITPPGGSSGTITYQGVKLGIDYLAADQKLFIRIAEKPPFIPESLIWQLLDARVEKCMGK